MKAKVAFQTLGSFIVLIAQAQSQTGATNSSAALATPDAAGIECVARLQMPTYPHLARSARVQGSVETVVVLGADGVVGRIDSITHAPVNERAGTLLAVPVEAAIRKAQFRPECANKRVSFTFQFSVTGDPYDRNQGEVEYAYPNKFWITVRPLVPMPN